MTLMNPQVIEQAVMVVSADSRESTIMLIWQHRAATVPFRETGIVLPSRRYYRGRLMAQRTGASWCVLMI